MSSMMEMPTELIDSLKYVTRRINTLERQVRGMATSSGAAFQSVESGDGSIVVYDDDGNVVSEFGDGGGIVYRDAGSCQPTPPDVEGVFDGLVISYDGTFEDGDWDDNQIAYVEIHAMALDTDTPDDTNQVGTFVSSSGGVFNYPWSAVDGGRWIVLVAVTVAGTEGTPSDAVFAVPDAVAPTDGLPPTTSPAVTVRPGVRSVLAYWTAITNPDPVVYDVYARNGSDPTSTSTYFIATTPGTSIGINHLTGGTAVDSTMDIHVMLVARDADGEGPDGATGHAVPIQINTVDLTNDAVTSAIIASGAVTAAEIASGAVIQDKIAARAISAEKLMLGSFDNLVQDPNFRTPLGTSWNNSYGVMSILPTGSRDGGPALRLTGAGAAFDCANLPIDTLTVEGGAAYRITASIRSDRVIVAGQYQVSIAWRLSDGTLSFFGGIVPVSGGVANTYANYSALVTAPSNAIRLYLIYVEGTPVSGQTVDMDFIAMTRAMTAQLIVDGSIVAGKIAANAVTAGTVAANVITSNEIAANTITAGDIAASTITTTEIAANTITAADIAAGTITATQIAANTITAAKIAAGTITATEIAANTITTAKLTATAIDGMTITAALFRTSSTVGIGHQGMTLSDDLSGGVIKFWTGVTGTGAETGEGWINPQSITLGVTPYPSVQLASPRTASLVRATIELSPVGIEYHSPQGHTFYGPISATGDIVADSLHMNGAISVFGGGGWSLTLPGNFTTPGDIKTTGTGDITSNNNLVTPNAPTSPASANARIGTGGVINIITSLTKYKVDPKPIAFDRLMKVLDIPVVEFYDAAEYKANNRRKTGLRQIPGVLAEDVEAAAPVFADYRDGKLQGVQYDRLGLAWIPLVKDLYARINELESRHG